MPNRDGNYSARRGGRDAPAPNNGGSLLFSSLLFSSNTCSRLGLAGVFPPTLLCITQQRGGGAAKWKEGRGPILASHLTGPYFLAPFYSKNVMTEETNLLARVVRHTSNTDMDMPTAGIEDGAQRKQGDLPLGAPRDAKGRKGRSGMPEQSRALTHSCRADTHTRTTQTRCPPSLFFVLL